jgi:K+-transporting ATPase KdpF subunit
LSSDRRLLRTGLDDGPGLRPAVGGTGFSLLLKGFMDYLIAGLISLALGVYLLYALLKPEKF